MEGSESRSHSKRDADDSADAQGSRKEDDEERVSKSRKHSNHDEAEEGSESGKKSGGSSIRAGSGDDVDYDARREMTGSYKIPRRSPENVAEKVASDGYRDKDGDSGRKRQEDETDWGSSRRWGSKSSGSDWEKHRSDNSEERWEDGDRRSGSDRFGTFIEDTKLADTSRGTGDNKLELYSVQESSGARLDGADQSDSRYSSKNVMNVEKLGHQLDSVRESYNDVEMRNKAYDLDGDGRSLLLDKRNTDHKWSQKPGTATNNEAREPAVGDDTKDQKGMDRNWIDKGRDREGTKDDWKDNWPRTSIRLDSEDAAQYDPVVDWKHGQERLDGGNFHGRPGYRKDSRLRSDSGKGSSAYGNRYDNSDYITIRPDRNLDFSKEGSISARRPDKGFQQDFPSAGNDDKWLNHPEDRARTNYGYSSDAQEKYYEDYSNSEQNSSRSAVESPSGRGRGLKGASTSQGVSNGLISPGGSQMLGSFNRDPQQGPKGGRPSRGGRGRTNGRDAQRVAVPVPMMGPPPFGHLGLPPGAMPPMGPNLVHAPGPLGGPGPFIPPFGAPLVWPGPRGMDISMLGVPPNLPMPLPGGPRFTPGSGHNMHLMQPGPGMTPLNMTGLGFNAMGTPSREMPHDKAPAGWTPHRNSGPAGKAPSRGEQNDYSQNFVDTGMRPQNFIRELDHTSIVEDYPKLRELIQRKDDIVKDSATPPMYYKCDLREQLLSPDFFGTKFDVILVDPPWEEYAHRAAGIVDHMDCWSHEEIMNLKIEGIADTPSFIFLWVGDGVGLEQGRQCLKKWGFRRCEDICWVKTNKTRTTGALRHDSRTLFQHSKEHCLMGIKGTVRRSTDGHIIHANIDTDIIIAEEPSDGSTKKPDDMYRIIEHFALGKRRLELFGEDHNIRPGWLTLGKDLTSSNFNKEGYVKNFSDKDGKLWQGGGGRNPPPGASHLVETTEEIESLRPKSPPQKGQQQHSMPPLGSGGGSSGNRRLFGNSAQGGGVTVVVGSETPSHAPWSSKPMMMGFGAPDGGGAGVLDGGSVFDAFGFASNPFSTAGPDHADFEAYRAANLFSG